MQEKLKSVPSIVTEIDLVYHNKIPSSDRPSVSKSSDAYELFRSTWDTDKIDLQEQFRIMLLDRRNSVLGVSTVATGGITACLVDLKIVFAMALKARATSIILAHNHPSGSKFPSKADMDLTVKFAQAGKILDLPVLDHIVVTEEGYTSMADEGILLGISENILQRLK